MALEWPACSIAVAADLSPVYPANLDNDGLSPAIVPGQSRQNTSESRLYVKIKSGGRRAGGVRGTASRR